MSADLSPQVLAALQAATFKAPTSGSGWSFATMYGPQDANLNYTAPDGNVYHVTYSSSGSVADGGVSYWPTGYLRDVIPGRSQVGDWEDMYDLYGRYQGTAQIPKDTSLRDFGIIAVMLTGFAVGTIMSAGTVASAAGGTSIAGDATLPGALASSGGQAIPYGSVLPGLEPYVLPVATATAGASIGSSIASAGATIGKALAPVTSLLGLATRPAVAPTAPVAGGPVLGNAPASVAAAQGIGGALLIAGGILALALALKKG